MTTKQGDIEQPYVVKPVFKALQVLIALGDEQRSLTLTEICHRVRLPKTTVFRYLQTLAQCGFVTHDRQADMYHLGARLFELGQLAGQQLRIRDVALPVMVALRDRFNETVNLGILDGYDVVYVEMVESHHSLRMQATLGSRDPAYSTALGKAMLAFIDEPARHLPARLMPRTTFTLHTRASVMKALAQARKEGYALDDQENEDGARCVGAPIFEYPGRVTAAISVSAPASRLGRDQVGDVAAALCAAAATISRQLGHVETSLPSF
ncbi:MAG: IclR family transcriptional regulator [Caldilineaceae bacterium]|nr:IclR family transcriptional regulator [Caldilineaceae bacterium]